jgi:hypothetical protein
MQDKIRIDIETGLYIETVHPSESGDDIISVECTGSYNLPRWNGEEWEEGGVATEPAPQASSEAERIEMLENTLLLLMME